jgi:hypothetical protein
MAKLPYPLLRLPINLLKVTGLVASCKHGCLCKASNAIALYPWKGVLSQFGLLDPMWSGYKEN